MEIIKRLVDLRRDQKKTRVEVANAMGVTDVSLWHYETGKRDVPFCKLVLWSQYLGYDMELVPRTFKVS